MLISGLLQSARKPTVTVTEAGDPLSSLSLGMRPLPGTTSTEMSNQLRVLFDGNKLKSFSSNVWDRERNALTPDVPAASGKLAHGPDLLSRVRTATECAMGVALTATVLADGAIMAQEEYPSALDGWIADRLGIKPIGVKPLVAVLLLFLMYATRRLQGGIAHRKRSLRRKRKGGNE